MPAEASVGQGLSAEDHRGPVVDGRYSILPDRRLPELDSPNGEAYQASDLTLPNRGVFALVCGKGAVARTDLMVRMGRLELEGLLMPRAWEVVAWRSPAARRLVIVFDRPGGPRLVPLGTTTIDPVAPHELTTRFVQPILAALLGLAERMMTHRAIRLDNLHYAEADRETVTLGDCLSEPPGYSQPAVYEPLEQAMADPSARSPGRAVDDCYALGVLLAILLAGKNPCEGMTDEETVTAKLNFGSYYLLLGQVSVPLGLTEPLRGLLSDDPGKRWTAADLDRWLGGNHLTPKPPGLAPKAARPFSFVGQDHWNVRSLAHAFASNWNEALEEVDKPGLGDWLTRSLGDAERAEIAGNPQVLTSAAQDDGATELDIRLAWILMVLDPQAPVRFKGFAAQPESLGQALGMNLGDGGAVQRIRAILRSGLPDFWFELQESNKPEYLPMRSQIGQATAALADTRLGHGLEHCLYRLHSEWPCCSPFFAEDYVASLAHLLPALERLAERGVTTRDLVDRHVAAFCLTRYRHLSPYAVKHLGSLDPGARTQAMLRILSEIQRAVGPDALPAMGAWFAAQLSASIEAFHNRAYRKQAAEEVERLAAEGKLADLAALFDNSRQRSADEAGYEVARGEYKRIAEHIAWLEQGGLMGRENVRRVSRQAAGIVSALLSGAMLVAMTLLYLV